MLKTRALSSSCFFVGPYVPSEFFAPKWGTLHQWSSVVAPVCQPIFIWWQHSRTQINTFLKILLSS